MSAQATSVRTYLIVFGTLMMLTALTVTAAYLDWGEHWNNVAALVIAVVQATLVALFFMHLRESKRLTWLVVGGGIFWFIILIAFTVSDLATRGLLTTGR